MADLLAGRFVTAGAAWLDLASGTTVRLRLAPAGSISAQLAWSHACETLAALRHPAMNVLVDYGTADARRTFEAYSAGAPIPASGPAGSALLTHAARFIEASGLPLTRDRAALAVRQILPAARSGPRRRQGRTPLPRPGGRPLGIILQDRRIVNTLHDALMETSPGGITAVEVTGEPGSGLRTVRTLVARLARLEGYVPVCGSLLHRCPWLVTSIAGRHVCVLLGDSEAIGDRLAAAKLLSDLTVSSARRHVFIRFRRAGGAGPGALHMAPMGVTAMTSMVYVDRDQGPCESELFDAARASGGNPGRFLTQLGAARFDDHVPRGIVVHESTTAYIVEPPGGPAGTRIPQRSPGRLVETHERAARLAGRGRHASAIRLLTRAIRVLEGRREPDLAARCAEALGWILRDRGRSEAAMEQFQRARSLPAGERAAVSAAVGVGVMWTDEGRFAEAEAALRGATTAATLLGDPNLLFRASIALGRCLYWQQRFEEALLLLELLAAPDDGHEGQPARLALVARARLGAGDVRGAVTAAAEAVRTAAAGRERAAAARAMVMAQAALGDPQAAVEHARRGMAAATAAHLPLAKLRLRAALLPVTGSSRDLEAMRLTARLRSALAHWSLSPLLREQLEAACAAADSPQARPRGRRTEPSMSDLQQLLELAHAAADDHTAAEEICRVLCERLRAATVQVITASSDRRLLARAGRPWAGDQQIFERALAMAVGTTMGGLGEPLQAVEIVRYGGDAIAILASRWAAGSIVDQAAAVAVIRAGALALGASLRGLLDRSQNQLPDAAWCEMIGTSPATAALRDAIARAARAPFPVLIEGESGSGKELVARAIHRLSARRERRLCALNCAAVADDLLEAELFGHARGAFTGAVGERAGLFEDADGGTLFLDEVGELSPRAQAKLLRVLQDGEVRRVGENSPRRVDARIIAATNRRLEEDAETGRFRMDLRFRLDVIRITVPPLRDRPTDVPVLAAHFWEEAARRVGSRATLAPETITVLARYDWPGNVRQLQNALASLAVHAPRRGRVTPALLPAQVARAGVPASATFEAAREEFERRFVVAALARAGGQRARAARALGITRQGLAKMLRRLGIDRA